MWTQAQRVPPGIRSFRELESATTFIFFKNMPPEDFLHLLD